jgi:(p)ppGpp synthase/HD superfamily hydrolase
VSNEVVHRRDWDLVRSALDLAVEANQGEVRKGTLIPYLSHLLAVAALVYEHGGSDTQVAAALLHDMAEDQHGEAALRLIGDALPGHPEVVEMVRALSDAVVDDPADKPPWLDRKTAYLNQLRQEGADVLLVSAADKLHNCRAVLLDYRQHGEQLWTRFNQGREWQLWYYTELASIFTERLPGPLADELRRTVDSLHDLVLAAVPDLDREIDAVRATVAAL